MFLISVCCTDPNPNIVHVLVQSTPNLSVNTENLRLGIHFTTSKIQLGKIFRVSNKLYSRSKSQLIHNTSGEECFPSVQ